MILSTPREDLINVGGAAQAWLGSRQRLSFQCCCNEVRAVSACREGGAVWDGGFWPGFSPML